VVLHGWTRLLGLAQAGKEVSHVTDEKINNIIPTIFAEIESDGENESEELLNYYLRCNAQERAVVDNVLMYLCGWTFETLLTKCGIRIGEKGHLLDVPEEE
jgi:hypothetical protein